MNDTFIVDDIQSEADLNKELPRAHFADFDQTVMRGNVRMLALTRATSACTLRGCCCGHRLDSLQILL